MFTQSAVKLIELSMFQHNYVKLEKCVLGEVIVSFDHHIFPKKEVYKIFSSLGFSVLESEEDLLLEKIKHAAIQLIHLSYNANSLIRNSDYISEKVQLSYDKISKLFSSKTGTTIEKYLILLKIEKAKELISGNEYSLSEISYMLGYSSVQYLSKQFKMITGETVSHFKSAPSCSRIALEDLV